MLTEDLGIQEGSIAAVYALLGVPFEQAVLIAPFALRRWEKVHAVWIKHRCEALGVAVLSPLSYVLVLTALVFTPVTATGHPRGRSASSSTS